MPGLLVALIAGNGLSRRLWTSQFLIPILKLVKLPVNATEREEFLVRPGFAQVAFVHYQNSVGALNGGKPVCDDDGSPAFDQPG